MDINGLWFTVAELLEEPLTEGPLYDLNHNHENGVDDYEARVSEFVDQFIASDWLRELRAQVWEEGAAVGTPETAVNPYRTGRR